ncbi:hypothetical protein [Algivirga pacifica]|uniref:Uncharacterized protein n=1 Tax=Algivirga pacifica TaxID=1162670 RepID=A0ABP9DAB2_9BACT
MKTIFSALLFLGAFTTLFAQESSLSSARDTLKKHQFTFDGTLVITGSTRRYDSNPAPYHIEEFGYEKRLMGMYISNNLLWDESLFTNMVGQGIQGTVIWRH